jgi:DNA-binding MarR family transcriptional regulator
MPDEDHVDMIVHAWAREDPALDTASIAVVGRLLRIARYLEREVALELARFGLSISEFNALSALRRTGNPYALSPTELSRALLLSSGGLTKLLERLESRGLIARSPDLSDGRGVVVKLTADGYSTQETAMQAHAENERQLLAPLSGPMRNELADTLRVLLIAFEDNEGRIRPVVRTPTPASQPAGERGRRR